MLYASQQIHLKRNHVANPGSKEGFTPWSNGPDYSGDGGESLALQ